MEVRETIRKSKEGTDATPAVEPEEYKEGIKRNDSCSDIASVKSDASKTKSVEIEVKDSEEQSKVDPQGEVEELKVEPVTESKKVEIEELEEDPASAITQDTV